MRLEAHMQTGCVEHLLVIGVVISTETRDDVPMVVVVESILNKGTRDLLNALNGAVVQVFIVLVEGVTGSYRIRMMVVDDVRIKQQVAIIGKLVGIIVGEAVIGVYLVVGHLMLRSKAGVFAVEVVTTFGKSLVTFSVDTDTVQIIAFIETMFRVKIHLSAETVLFQRFNAQLATKTSRVRMVIAQEDIILRSQRVVHERVAIAVHFHVVVAHMAEEHDAVLLSHLGSDIEVKVSHRHGVGIQVEKHFLALVLQGFLIVHVDLSRDRLVTISNRGSSF